MAMSDADGARGLVARVDTDRARQSGRSRQRHWTKAIG
jgi:hypothetical protein